MGFGNTVRSSARKTLWAAARDVKAEKVKRRWGTDGRFDSLCLETGVASFTARVVLFLSQSWNLHYLTVNAVQMRPFSQDHPVSSPSP